MSSPQDQQEATRKGIQDQKAAIQRTFSPAPAASPTIQCPKGALTQQQAQERFDKFKRREDIPWDYPQDCCYNRAHVMAKELQAEGVDVGKVWNYAPTRTADNLLRVSVPKSNAPQGYVEWGYHVAPTVPVMDPRGNICRMVIDPSITDGPIMPDQWKALQGQPRSELVLTNASPYYRDVSGLVDPPPSDRTVRAVFDTHRRRRDDIRAKAAAAARAKKE